MPDPSPTFPDVDLAELGALLRQHLGRAPQSLTPVPTYTDTIVVEARVGDTRVIFKAADPAGSDPSRISLEAWAYGRVRSAGVPSPAVLALDDSSVTFPAPYMIMERVDGEALSKVRLSIDERRSYLRQFGHLVRTLHSIQVPGYGWLDDRRYVSSRDVRGHAGSWHEAIEREVGPAVAYFLDKELIDPAGATHIRSLLTLSAPYLSARPSTSLLHGDLGAEAVFVGQSGIVAVIDWGNAWAGDPLWDLATFDWEGGQEFRWLVEGYEPDVPIADIIDTYLPFYTVFQAVPWAAWCHKRGHLRPLRALKSAVRIARDLIAG